MESTKGNVTDAYGENALLEALSLKELEALKEDAINTLGEENAEDIVKRIEEEQRQRLADSLRYVLYI
jgi:hypothetical protein